jgi:hypothetical protein
VQLLAPPLLQQQARTTVAQRSLRLPQELFIAFKWISSPQWKMNLRFTLANYSGSSMNMTMVG